MFSGGATGMEVGETCSTSISCFGILIFFLCRQIKKSSTMNQRYPRSVVTIRKSSRLLRLLRIPPARHMNTVKENTIRGALTGESRGLVRTCFALMIIEKLIKTLPSSAWKHVDSEPAVRGSSSKTKGEQGQQTDGRQGEASDLEHCAALQ